MRQNVVNFRNPLNFFKKQKWRAAWRPWRCASTTGGLDDFTSDTDEMFRKTLQLSQSTRNVNPTVPTQPAEWRRRLSWDTSLLRGHPRHDRLKYELLIRHSSRQAPCKGRDKNQKTLFNATNETIRGLLLTPGGKKKRSSRKKSAAVEEMRSE